MTGQQQNTETREALKGMEYTLSQYFDEQFTPILNDVTNEIIPKARQAQSEIIFGAMSNTYSPNMVTAGYGYRPSKSASEWCSKNLDDVYSQSIERFMGNPKITADLATIAEGYRAVLVQELGVERYKSLSEQLQNQLGDASSGDLAADYIEHRLEQLYIERLAKNGMPSSSLEYIFKNGLSGSFIGMLWNGGATGNLEAAANEYGKKIYGEKWYETLGRKTVEYGLDALTFGTGLGLKSAIKFTCLEGSLVLADKGIDKLTKENVVNYDEYFSEMVYGDKEVLPQLQKESKNIDATESKIVEVMNENLQNKVTAFKSFAKPIDFKSMAMGEIPTPDYSLLPKEEKKEEERPEGVPSVIAPGKEKEYLETKAAEEAAKKTSEQTAPSTKDGRPLETYSGPRGTYVMMSAPQNTMSGYPQGQMPRQQNFIQPQQMPFSPKQEMMNGWRGLTDMLGLTSMSDLGKNSGYVLAMLPDMIMGMFTGKYKSLRFEDNVFPIASILVGMFVKNPILKFLLIAMGGANLLNKAGHEALDKAGYNTPSRQYRKYENQELSDRIKDVAIKGDTLLATIDGVPQLITIKSEKALDAYYKGYLPINTLANAVLDKYDEQNKAVISNYERGMAENEEHRRVVGIK